MFNALDQRLKKAFPIVGAPNQVKSIKRDYNPLESLSNITIAGEFPDLLPEVQVIFKESLEIFGLGFGLRAFDEFVEPRDICFAGPGGSQIERQRLEFNSE